MNKFIPDHFKLKKITQKLALATLGSTLASSLYGQAYYGYVDVAGYQFLGGHSQTDGLVDALLPLYQKPNSLYFLNFRGFVKSDSQLEGNYGIGSRWLNQDNTQLFGVHGYYDRRTTETGNTFNQIMAGAEYWYKNIFLGANVFIPVGTTEKRAGNYDHAALKEISEGVYRIEYGVGSEKALTGFDAELGYELLPGLIAYAGAYTFTAKDIEKSVTGPKARLLYEWSRVSQGQKVLGLFDGISLESEYRHDQERGSVWYGGVRFKVGIGKTPPLTGVARHMIDRVRRDIDLVTTGKTGPKEELDGDAQVVSDAEALKNAVGNNEVKYIFVNGNINGIDETISLGNNQVLSGGQLTFKTNDGKSTITGQFMNETGSLTANGVDLIHVNQNNTIAGINLNIKPDNRDDADLYAVISNADSSTSIGTLTLQNIVANQGQISIHVDGENNSRNTVLYQNNQVNIDYTGANDKIGGVEFLSSENATLNVEFLGQNSIHTQGDNVLGLYNRAEAGGKLNLIGSTESSRSILQITTQGGNANGVDISATDAGEIALEGIDFHITTDGNNAHAFYGFTNGEVGTSKLTIKNSFYNSTLTTKGDSANGFYLNQMDNSYINVSNSFSGGQIKTEGTSANGVHILSNHHGNNFENAGVDITASFDANNTIRTSGIDADGLRITAIEKGEINFENSLYNTISTEGVGAYGIRNLAETGGNITYTNSLNNTSKIITKGNSSHGISAESNKGGEIVFDSSLQNNQVHVQGNGSYAYKIGSTGGSANSSSIVRFENGSLTSNLISYGENGGGILSEIGEGTNFIFYRGNSLTDNNITDLDNNQNPNDIVFNTPSGETNIGEISVDYSGDFEDLDVSEANNGANFSCSGDKFTLNGEPIACD